MSRGWSRGRGQSVSLPLDTLFKESANRPSASRSAGTVGKWGITSFTSIRNTSLGGISGGCLNAYGNQQLQKSDYNNSLKGGTNSCNFERSSELTQNTNTANIQTVKPKKFFKSRNVVTLDATETNKVSNNNKFSSNSANVNSPTKVIPNKSKTNREEIPKLKISLDKSKYSKHKYFSAKNLKNDRKLNVNVNSKYSSRNKGKIVNYSEENSCSPPNSPPILENITLQQVESSPISPKRQLEHPPIVLRISKGTSRLISTDSESGVVSPQHTTSVSSNCKSPAVADALESTSTSTSFPVQEAIKLTIRTKDVKLCSSRYEKTHSKIDPNAVNKHSKIESGGESSRAARASRRNQQKNKDDTVAKTEKRKSSPQPGSENYELYRTLASPVDKEEEINESNVNDSQVFSNTQNRSEVTGNDVNSVDVMEHNSEDVSGMSSVDKIISYSKNTKARVIGQKHKNVSLDNSSCSLAKNKCTVEDQPHDFGSHGGDDTNHDDLNTVTTTVNYSENDKVSNWCEPNESNKPTKQDAIVEQNSSQIENPPEANILSETQPPSVKLVISKKKGSIFKSRALVNDGSNSNGKKRHVYRHKTWQFDEQKTTASNEDTAPTSSFDFDDGSAVLTRVPRIQQNLDSSDSDPVMSVLCPKEAKGYYTVVRNVKKAHQIQEIGEEQELNDDVEYILDALQDNNPMSTRCLSAITLASKCMTPAFRMHVRAHNTVTKFFRALHDATKDQSLGLCTATVMFVLSQDQLNMDVDRNSLELMLNLLESDVSHQHALDDCGLSLAQLHKNKQKVRELCEEIKCQGKAVHLNLDNITVGQLAMETLLSMTSKRAGEWFKEELRQLGGLDHILKTVCDCCSQVSGSIEEWTDLLLDKLRKIERCLRVLENVTQLNEENQTYLLHYGDGIAVQTLVQLYQLCDKMIPQHPTISDDKDCAGVVFRETLLPTLKVLINLTHSFNPKSIGSSVIGQKSEVIDISLHLLLEVQNYIPHQKNFELSILALLLLINLVQYNIENKSYLMNAKSDTQTACIYIYGKRAVVALTEYFYRREQLARLEEQTTDAILDGAKDDRSEDANKPKTHEEFIEETVSKLLQKAGSHMEHTMVASYIVLLLGYMITDCPDHECELTKILPNNSYSTMILVLTKYYKFMNLTGSGDTSIVNHITQTGIVLKYLEQLEKRLIDQKQNSVSGSTESNMSEISDNH